LTCFAATPNTELIDNVIRAEVARLVTDRILYMVKKNGLIVKTRPLSKCYLNSIKGTSGGDKHPEKYLALEQTPDSRCAIFNPTN
jgi:hypothetical protein